MNIVLRHEKAKAWLAAKFNGLSVGPLADGKYCIELDGKEHVIEFPDRRILMHLEECREFLHGGKCVFLYGWTMNPYLADVIAFLSRKFPQKMAEVAEAFGVERIDCTAEGLPTEPCILIEKLPDVEPDGKRTVFELMARAIRRALKAPVAESGEPPVPRKLSPEERESKAKLILEDAPYTTSRELGDALGVVASTVVGMKAWKENRANKGARKLGKYKDWEQFEEKQAREGNDRRQYSECLPRDAEAKTDDNSDDDDIDDA